MDGIIAQRMSVLKPSPTIAISDNARKLKAQGLDVISLGAGEPDFLTPEHVQEAACKAIRSGAHKYTAVSGIDELKEAIIGKFKVDNNLDYQKNQIIVSTGAKQVLYNLLLAIINPGDEIIVPAPYWVSYIDMVLIAGGKPVVAKCNDDFSLSKDELERLITSKTKLLMLNYPNNPSGAIPSEGNLRDIANVLLKHENVHVVSDDIYEYIVYGETKFNNIASVCPELKNRVFAINGVSKSYSMTGWRIGYGAGNSTIVKAMSTLQSQSTSCPSSIAQAASVAAMTQPRDFLKERIEQFKIRRDNTLTALNNIAGLHCRVPYGAFYLFISCKDLIGKKPPGGSVIKNDSDFTLYLLEEHLVSVVPGIAFGLEGFFRLSYATSDDVLAEACKRIAVACKNLQ